ncbi:hypothetical protein CH373_17410 [Leptospira perolatii]|uniref:DUF5683 domain-containing protein n=1 Tax=Leptospira perolatii TaxID=2023191 RepID=A0A2M9ZIF7_9LEPT|nr:hypothetical protein [Leptospira perolatii]PJZ68360.1 hypothetical protein CH360_16695 [Leptospira perolatii]PJZ71848.1 hypothetical protein CH373_17410 [Leptospira perolatii]
MARIGLVTALLLLLFTFDLIGATLIMKNGKVLQGKIVNQTRTDVEIEVNGKVFSIPKTEIQELKLKDAPKERVKPKEEQVVVQEAPKKERFWHKPRWNYPLSSAVLPGWGVWKSDKKLLGIGTFAAVIVLAYLAVDSDSKLKEAKHAYENNVYTYVFVSQQDPTLNPPSATLPRVLLGAGYSGPSFDKYDAAAQHANLTLIAFGLAYGGQILYSYFLGVQKEKAQALSPAVSASEGLKFSAFPSFVPTANGGNGLGWNAQASYSMSF